MIAGPFDHRNGTRIAHREAFTGHAFEMGLARDGAIEHRVADDDVPGWIARNARRLAHHHTAAGKALADIVIGIAHQFERNPMGEESAEALPGGAVEADMNGVFRQTRMAVTPRDFARQHGAHRAMHVADGAFEPDRLPGFDGGLHGRDQFAVQRLIETVILFFAMADRDTRFRGHLIKQLRQIDAFGLPMADGLARIDAIHPADHLIDRAEAEFGHDAAQFFRHEEEVIDHMFRLAGETLAQNRVLCRNADRAGVEMAFAHHDAARCDQRRGGETEFIGAEQNAHRHVAPGAEAAIGLYRDAAAQTVQHKCLLGFGEADFPRTAGMGERGQRRSTGAAFITRNRHMIGARLGNTGGNRADAHFRHQLDRDARGRIDAFQIVDQLGQVFDRIDVVMRRRRNEADTGGGMAHAGDILVHLVAGQLPAFAGFRPLRHLDLQIVGIDEIFRRDAEAARGHLFDGGTHGIAIGQRFETIRFLPALARVGTAADTVHRNREIGVRFTADRTEAHRAGGETLDDFGSRLHRLQRDAGAVGLEFHQAADGEQPFVLLIDGFGKGEIFRRLVAAHRVLKPRHGVGRPGMIFAAQAESIIAADIQHRIVDRVAAEGGFVPAQGFLGNLGQANAFDRGRCAGEIFFDKGGGEPDRIENLRAAIGLIGGDAHFGHHLHHTLFHCLDVVLLHFVSGDRQFLFGADLLQRIEGEIGIDRLGAITGQHTEMMHLTGFAGFNHQPRLHAQALTDQMMMHRRGGKRGRNRNACGRNRAVGQNEDIGIGQHGVGRLLTDFGHGRFETGSTFRRRPGAIDRHRAQRAIEQGFDGTDFLQIAVGQDRVRHFQPLVRAGLTAEQIGPGPDHRNQRHHQFFADRVDRRVGDLGKALFEIIVEQLWLLREHGQWRVGAHRADGIIARFRHRFEEEFDVFLGVAEGLLPVEKFLRGIRAARRRLRRIRQIFKLVLRFFQPFGIRPGGGEIALDLLILDDAALFEIDQQHFARLQPPFARDFFFRHRQHARFGGEDHQIVRGDDVARGPETVAVQRGADLPAVGEGNRSRTIPRFEQGGMIFVERLAARIHQRVAGPGFRNQHHHRMRQRITARHQKFERIVDTRRIGLAMRDQRPHLVEIGAQQIRFHRAAARIHPIHIAAHGVDFTVVRDEAIGMGELPRRKRVGGETLMHQRDGRLRQRIAQIVIKAADIGGEQQTLVDHRARRKRRHVEIGDRRVLMLSRKLAQRILRLLADGEQLALKRILIADILALRDDRLTDQRRLIEHGFAEALWRHRHIAPADQTLPFHLDEMFKAANDDVARGGIARQETHRHRILAKRGKIDPGFFRPVAQQRIGNLNQAACPVTHQRIGADGAAMVEVDQKLQPLRDDIVRFPALDVRDKADATGVVLAGSIIKTLGRRITHVNPDGLSDNRAAFGRPSLICCDAARLASAKMTRGAVASELYYNLCGNNA